jgi:hypothetical protein
MKINSNYNGTVIGAIFTVASILLTFTFIVPIISVIPAAYIESLVASIVDNEPYSNVGKATLNTFLGLLIVFVLIVLIKSRRNRMSNVNIILIMIIAYFIVHSLGFYMYWGVSLNYRSDGQLIFAAVDSFPLSSFGFVFIGFLIDIVKKPMVKG